MAAPSEMKKQTSKDANVNFISFRYLRMAAELFEGQNMRLTPGFSMSEIKFTSQVKELLEVASFLCKVQSSVAIG